MHVLVMQEAEQRSGYVHDLHSTSKPVFPIPPLSYPEGEKGCTTYLSLRLYANNIAVSSDVGGAGNAGNE